jgi:hypothetical protein
MKRKMKIKTLIKIVPVLLAGFFLAPGAEANPLKDGVPVFTAPVVTVECWMFDAGYLSPETVAVENWMLDENWLESSAEVSPVENWMFDEEYLEVEYSGIESWMLDPGYLESENDNVN